ncbi:MAG: c-type cytochrome [Acidimicrobiales bacterium]|nr:c-type cytochrome [Acidimicrobiales bacterium]
MAGLVAFSPGPASALPTSTQYTPIQSTPGPGKLEPLTPGSHVVPSGSTATPGSGLSYVALPRSFVNPGEALFSANCATCHGNDAAGTNRAPPLLYLGAGTVDFWVSTGRMPLANSSVQATRKPSRFNRLQTLQIATFVQSLTPGVGVGIPIVDENGADLEDGNAQFTLNCAACHTITGAGDALAEGAVAPSLHLATPTQIVEAMRSGPGNMPRFSPGNITDSEARNVATYVNTVIQHPVNRGGIGLGGIGPVGEGFIGLLVGVGILMLVGFWIGDRS